MRPATESGNRYTVSGGVQVPGSPTWVCTPTPYSPALGPLQSAQGSRTCSYMSTMTDRCRESPQVKIWPWPGP